MKKTKAVLMMLAAALLIVGFAACNNDDDDQYLIASLQIAEHPSLDAAREGFIDALADEGFVMGENLDFRVFNAQGDMSNAHMMAAQIVDLDPNLILGIATPTSQALAEATDEIPITITAITSPYNAGLVDSHERPGRNVTGTTDLTPVATQFDLIMRLFPDTQTVGIMYNSGEANSVYQAELAQTAADRLGIELVHGAVAVAGDIVQAAQNLVGRVDVIYTPTCNTMATGMPSIIQIADEFNIPVVAGDGGSVKNGALVSEGIDYYALGRQTGVMAAQILRGEAEPATMPIQSQTTFEFFVNITTANNMGITLPEEIMSAATLYED